MDSNSIEKYLMLMPIPLLRLTLSSGDQVVIGDDDEPFVEGLTLVLRGRKDAGRLAGGPRLVSIPNIVLVEPVEAKPPRGRAGRR